jgi:hypothetical protein
LPGEKPSETIRVVYPEVCKTLSGIDDFRARLLALLPISSGAGIFLLLGADANGHYLGAIGLVGFLASLGLFVYELGQSAICRHLIAAGELLEKDMRLTKGQFLDRPTLFKKRPKPLEALGITTWVGVASWLVYLTVLAAWAYLAFVGFTAKSD